MSQRSSQNYLRKHVLICTVDSCADYGAEGVRDALKAELKERGLRLRIRDGACSCLGLCMKGVNAVIWPEGTWLSGLKKSDVPRLVDFLQGTGEPLTDREELANKKIAIKLKEG